MRIKTLKIAGITTHKNTEISLPLTGLVVITGDNGSGKSSIIEAVPVCRWGKSLRGTDVWAGPGEVELEEWDGPTYIRKRTTSGRTTLKTKEGPEYQTAARAKREIGGDPKIWERSCVFSSEDVPPFTRATDAERKRMLESALGLNRFDDALTQCRAELKDARHAEDLARSRESSAASQWSQAKSNLETLRESLAIGLPDGDPVAMRSELEKIECDIPGMDPHQATLQADVSALRIESNAIQGTLRDLDRQISDQRDSVCSSCNRPFDDNHDPAVRVAALAELAVQHAVATEDLQRVVSEGRQAAEELRAALHRVDTLRASARELQIRIRAHDDYAPRRAIVDEKIAQAEKVVADLDAQRSDAAKQVASTTTHAETLAAADRVLGTRGLRAHVLGEALTGLEHAANYWLERFCPGVSVKMAPTRELKGGGVSDEISIELTGVANGHGYKGSSRGERRRQDVAITWAFGEVEAAASGLAQSTMFCDEPFDALDAAGVDALVTALDEVRQRRCIVVISHSLDLIKALHPDVYYHVEDGVVHRRW